MALGYPFGGQNYDYKDEDGKSFSYESPDFKAFHTLGKAMIAQAGKSIEFLDAEGA